MSASALYRCVAVFELCDRLNVVSRWSRITVSHLRVVLPFDEQEQCRLIAAANSERWSVQRLEHEARKAAPNPAKRGGRSATPELVRFGRSIEKLHRSSSVVRDSLPQVARSLGEQYLRIAQNIEQSIRSLEQARAVLDPLGRRSGGRSPSRSRTEDPAPPDDGGLVFEESAIHYLDAHSAEE